LLEETGLIQIAENHRLFGRIVERAEVSLKRADLESAVVWAKIAAHFASIRHPGIDRSPELDKLLADVAQRIQTEPPNVSGAFFLKNHPRNFGKMHFFHVLTDSASEKESQFVAGWIRNTCDSAVHSIATTQNTPLAADMRDALCGSSGFYCVLADLSPRLTEQALLLKLLAQSWADVIVLSTLPYDPVPVVAFAVDGGPPIMAVNHGDSGFTLGSCVADMALDYCHGSGMEVSAKRRGTQLTKLLPIPLTETHPAEVADRASLKLSPQAEVILTVGCKEQYCPFGGYDFLSVMVGFLKKHPYAKLVAAGPELRGEWRVAAAAVEGRIEALGTVNSEMLESYFAAADVYVPSFPNGNGVEVLKAVLHDLPIVGLCPSELPCLSLRDDVALRSFSVYATSIADFEAALDFTLKNAALGSKNVLRLKRCVKAEHCPPGWSRHLDNVLQALPSQHTTKPPALPQSGGVLADFYWASVGAQLVNNEAPEYTLRRLIRAYGSHLSTVSVLGAQAETFMSAFAEIDRFKRAKQFLMDSKDFVLSAFS
jgi:hypothetical protein